MGCIDFPYKTIKEPSSLSNFQEKNYLKYFGIFWDLMALASPPSWMGKKGHKIQVGPDGLRKASTSTPIERPSGQIGFGRSPT